MSLLPYRTPVPCYQTVDITQYSAANFTIASTLFTNVQNLVGRDQYEICKGSFSILATSSDETAAKIVICERHIGKWHASDPGWQDGTYIWVRANGLSGAAFDMAASDDSFEHQWALTKFAPEAAVSVAPHPTEHFYYFMLNQDDDEGATVELLAFCSTL